MKPGTELVTFGCRLNAYESEVIRENLAAAGRDNVIVVNTCAVTAEAERQARQAIRRLRRDHPAAEIVVTGFNSLLMDFAQQMGAGIVIRGIRGVTDFEYEYQLTGMNRQLNDQIETVFLMADVELQPIASRLVKEIAFYGGPIGKFVTPAVRADVEARVQKLGPRGG